MHAFKKLSIIIALLIWNCGCETAPPLPAMPDGWSPENDTPVKTKHEGRGPDLAAELAADYIAANHQGGAMKTFKVKSNVHGRPWTRYYLILDMQDGRQWEAVVTIWAWRDSHTVNRVKLIEP